MVWYVKILAQPVLWYFAEPFVCMKLFGRGAGGNFFSEKGSPRKAKVYLILSNCPTNLSIAVIVAVSFFAYSEAKSSFFCWMKVRWR